jgi:thiopeptide-type bacteriocin biosynthesis protein
MPRVIFNSFLFLRTPALSRASYEPAQLSSVLKEQFFQSAIFFASESLYSELSRHDFNYDCLDDKIKFTLQKYLNRMCYRPTPFGMFSAFASLGWNRFDIQGACVLDKTEKVYINPDFQFVADLARQMESSRQFPLVKYFVNNAIYAIKGEKRYLAQYFDQKRKKTDFFINSFESNRLLNKLLKFSGNGKTRGELTAWLLAFVEDQNDVENYIDDLINEGILISELLPNMSGPKYFDRLSAMICRSGEKSPLAEAVLEFGKLLGDIRAASGPDLEKISANDIYKKARENYKSMFYVATERQSTSTLDRKYQDNIRDALNCLGKISIDASIKPLSDFASKFRARYEDQEIPLLQALDHESGIGYQGLENNLLTSELLDGIQLDLHSNTLNFNWTQVHELFLTKLVEIREDEPVLITDKELEKLKDQVPLKTPPSFSIIFRVLGDKVWIEQAGGCTAAALLGRFTLFSEKVLDEAKYITAVEERTNEDVVFAEISCFNDEHAANINSHAGVRNYEIPVGVHSTYDKEAIIKLSDLALSVIGGRIFLRSRRLNKFVIPRLSSAYNYSRSELTVFRFLCDLQYQGLKASYNFELRSLLPGLKYYPRVEYKNSILCPATWLLGAEEIEKLTDRQSFFKISSKIRLAENFAFAEGDNQLLFNRYDPQSVDFFLKVVRNKKLALLQEAFVESDTKVVDETGLPYAGQFIASVFSDIVTYDHHKTQPAVSIKGNKARRIYLPGDEWVYLKLYCHPAISNSILVKEIARIVAYLKKQKMLKTWFFIRYADPDSHLRIRIQTDPENVSRIVQRFERRMRILVERGSINNIIIDTYKRELERYGGQTIEYAEQVFNASSDVVINYIKNTRRRDTEFSELHLAAISVNVLLSMLPVHNNEKAALLKLMHEGMKPEFDDSKQLKFQLDTKYREYAGFFNNLEKNRPGVVRLAGKKQFDDYLSVLEVFKAKTKSMGLAELKKLVADIIHMHLNRLFNDRQRNHEFIVYYLLSKYYVSAEARKEKGVLSFTPTFKGFGVNQVSESLFK